MTWKLFSFGHGDSSGLGHVIIRLTYQKRMEKVSTPTTFTSTSFVLLPVSPAQCILFLV